MRRAVHAVLVASIAVAVLGPLVTTAQATEDPRYFLETGYKIRNDQFWDYFQRRGGIKTFGYPVSRPFTLLGFNVQFLQRAVMQLQPDGSVSTMNILDPGLMPYTQINGSTFPAPDPEMARAAPTPRDPQYANHIIDFVKLNAPDTWNGSNVNFLKTFMSTVGYSDAFPNGDAPRSLVPLLDLEMWGAPTSAPASDPNNHNFVYQRFQRGIMHYDATNDTTQGLLLADYLKAMITGQNLPPDLDAQARGSPFYHQYNNSRPLGMNNPAALPGTDMSDAFEKDSPQSPVGSGPAPYWARSPEYGMNIFIWDAPSTTERDLNKLNQLGFTWQKTLFQWRQIEGAGKGQFNWSEADRVVKASNAHGIDVIARLDQEPKWARRDGAPNGPPDKYQDYADFVYAFVDRYRTGSPHGHVAAVEIWNEPNLSREWGNQPINQHSAVDYTRLLKLSYEAAKRADPSATVISAGLSPTETNNNDARPDDVYLQWMYDAGAKPYFDVLGAHGAGYKAPPSVSPDEAAANPGYGSHRFFTFRRVEDLRNVMVRNGDADKQIWLMEFGWTSDEVHPAYAWHRVTEQQKAQYIVDAFRWAHDHWSPWIGVMSLWNMASPDWGPSREEYWWSITNPDGTSRPAFDALLQARRSGYLP